MGGNPGAALFNSGLFFLMIGLTVLLLLIPFITNRFGKWKQNKND